MRPTRVFTQDPCLGGLVEILTVAHSEASKCLELLIRTLAALRGSWTTPTFFCSFTRWGPYPQLRMPFSHSYGSFFEVLAYLGLWLRALHLHRIIQRGQSQFDDGGI